jgi:thiol-disulfide isomerase/thioredoxin
MKRWIGVLICVALTQSYSQETSNLDSAIQKNKRIKPIPIDSTKGPIRGTIDLDSHAYAIMKKMADAYRNLKSYQFEGTMQTEMTTQGMHNSFETPFSLAAVKPRKVRYEVRNAYSGMFSVSSGETTWTYMASLKQYTKQAVPKVESLADSSDHGAVETLNPASAMLSEYSMMLSKLKSLRFLREESLLRDGTAVPCDVVEVELIPTPMPAGMEMTMKPRTLWVERRRNIVLADSTFVTMKSPQLPQPMEMTQVRRYTTAMLNGSVPDSLFTFATPEGAQLVDDFNIPGMKKSTLEGTTAKTFTLKDLQGKTVVLQSLHGKVVLLDFWASWCGPCRAELPTIEKLHKEFGRKGLVVLGINDESAEVASKFMKEQQYTFSTLVDGKREASNAYGVNAIPMVVIIDKIGNISTQFIGARSEEVLRKALEKAGMK